MYNVAYVTDNGYLLPTKASIASLVQSANGEEITVYVVTFGVSEERRRELVSLGQGGVCVRVKALTDVFRPKKFQHAYLTNTAFAKFQLPEIFPDLSTLLYLDGDTLLAPGFASVFKTDIRAAYAAVVMDMCAMAEGEWHRKLGCERYFNTGVMYLNLAKMREDGVPQKLRDCSDRDDYSFVFGEQNAINAVFGRDVVFLSPAYNFFSHIYPQRFSTEAVARFFGVSEEVLKAPLIRHLAGSRKPWLSPDLDVGADWIRFVSSEDHLAVARNYCITLAGDLATGLEKERKCTAKALADRVNPIVRDLSRLNDAVANLKTVAAGRAANPYCLGNDMLATRTDGVLLEGFYREEPWGRWAGASCSMQINLGQTLKPSAGFLLSLRMRSFHVPRNVDITLNGTLLHEATATPQGLDFIVKVDRNLIRSDNILAFTSDKEAESPADLATGADKRTLGIGFSYIRLEEDSPALFQQIQTKLAEAEERIAEQERRLARLESELQGLRFFSSLLAKIWRAVTFLPRAVHRFLRKLNPFAPPDGQA